MGAEAAFLQHVQDLTVADAAVVTQYHETMRVSIPSCRGSIEHTGGIEKRWLRWGGLWSIHVEADHLAPGAGANPSTVDDPMEGIPLIWVRGPQDLAALSRGRDARRSGRTGTILCR